MTIKITIACILAFCCNSTFAQVDSTMTFARTKGTWNYPMSSISKIQAVGQSKDSDLVKSKAVRFTSAVPCSANALFSGKVSQIALIENIYVVIVKYGDYYLTYSGLEKPIVKVGEFIKTGQPISNIAKQSTINDGYSLDILLSTKDGMLAPFSWFKKNGA